VPGRVYSYKGASNPTARGRIGTFDPAFRDRIG
jgi:hypothetical protein